MIIPILTFVYDRKKQAKPKKEAPVELRITYNRKCKYITTGIRLLPKHWKNGTVTNRIDAKEINDSLGQMMANVRKVINTMSEESELNIAEIKSRLMKLANNDQSFIEYCEKRAKVRTYGKSEDTKERYTRFLKWMCDWGCIKFFSDVTDANVIEMDKTLTATGMKNYSKWNNYHRFLNSFILDAIDDGLLKRNPYKWIRIQKDKTSGIGKYLSEEELKCIELAKMPTDTLDKVRDLFVFQTYTCLSYVDLAAFDESHSVRLSDGTLLYTSRRGKTNMEFSFVILAKARLILEKYNGHLPIISNQKYNDYLKAVAQYAGIDKPITSHWARHTGATLLLNHGVDMEVIAKILGHSSTKQTRQTYAKLTGGTIADSMNRFEKTLK